MGHTKNIFCHESKSIHSAVASGFLIRLETVWKNQYTFDRDKFAKSVLEQGWLGGSDVGRVLLPPRFSIRSPSSPSLSLPSNQPALKSCNIFRSNQLIMSSSDFQILNFDVRKKRTKLPKLGSGGGLGNSGNARKKTFFFKLTSSLSCHKFDLLLLKSIYLSKWINGLGSLSIDFNIWINPSRDTLVYYY